MDLLRISGEGRCIFMRRGDIQQSCFLLSLLLTGILYSIYFEYSIQNVNE